MDKTAGILFAISSLPSKYGIGCFSKEAYKFVDWLVEAGQTFWQILPLGPTGYGDSPYNIMDGMYCFARLVREAGIRTVQSIRRS